ncbi:uncharacterized protein LOC110026915 [Phalaenopsis equestris]|uniref:uncharacterized protein LOC110026915 n=1 Tax=Phalaenopsis equestris TaxID=78828 RepID=UPI0009E4AD24|nr:uncharacterized protein LOC110026915 [Phalaenopsis equestris]
MVGATAGAERVEEMVIVGGGIAGIATALALKRVGKGCLILERWHELRESGAAVGIQPNAWRALNALGIANKLIPNYGILQGGNVRNLETGTVQRVVFAGSSDREGYEARVVHRKALLEALAEEIPPESIRFCSKLASIRTEVGPDSSNITVLQLEDGDIIKAKAVIGCDGLHSVVAQWLGLAPPRHSGRSAVRGLAVFPEGHGLNHEVQTFLTADKRGGFTPLNDHDVYWFIVHLTTPKVKEMGRHPELIQREVLLNLAVDLPPKLTEMVNHTVPSSLTWDPLMFRAPWQVLFGRAHRGCVTVAGDAFHPTTPDLGQGACVALEDAVVLARCLARAESPKEVEESMERYVAERRWRVAGIITASYFSGSVQQASAGVWTRVVRLVRDFLFYRFIFTWISGLARFDCGSLPRVEEK